MKMNSKLARLAMGVVVLGCTTTWQNCLAQANDPLSSVKELYGYSEWEGQTKEHYEQIVTNWVPDLGSMGITNFDVVADREDRTNSFSQKYTLINLYPSEAPTVSVRLIVHECLDVTNAELALLSELITQSPVPSYVLGSSIGLDLGDRCYAPSSGGVSERVVLVRNNVCLSLEAFRYSVLRLAEKLDCELLVRSFSGPVLLQPGITQGAFHANVPTVSGKIYFLESSGSPAGTNWLSYTRVLVGDGTIGIVTRPAFSPGEEYFRLRVE